MNKTIATIFITVFASFLLATSVTAGMMGPVTEAGPAVPIGGGTILGENNKFCHIRCKGDINDDGQVNFKDINPMTMVLKWPWFFEHFFPQTYWAADIGLPYDGVVDVKDINPFVDLMAKGEASTYWSCEQRPACVAAVDNQAPNNQSAI
jgi:hypothetical protein